MIVFNADRFAWLPCTSSEAVLVEEISGTVYRKQCQAEAYCKKALSRA